MTPLPQSAPGTTRGLRIGAAALLMTVVSCVWPTTSCGCDPAPQFALPVSGLVSRESGAPASGALVHAQAFAGTCPASDALSVDDGGAVALTDAEGRFRVVVRTFQSVPIACIRVHYFTDSTRATVPVASVDYAGRRIAQNGIGAPVDSLMVTRRWP